MDPLDALRHAAALAAHRRSAQLEAVAERDRLIVEARRAGASLREIARAAGISPHMVEKVLDRG